MIELISEWIKRAVPSPTDKNKNVQIGCHIEEVAEMLDALGLHSQASIMDDLATQLKSGELVLNHSLVNRKELLDACCDQVVTATGVATMYGMDINEGCRRVNISNWSKFVNGQPVFDENGKIKKGPNYIKPNLEGLY